MNPIKILHIIVALPIGGAERSLQRLVTAHADDSRFQHVVVSLTSMGAVGAELRARGVPVTALGITSIGRAPMGFVRLWKLIRTERPDIVQTWLYHGDLFGGVTARLAGCSNVVWNVRATDVAFGTSGLTAFIRRACALLSHVVPVRIVCVAESARRSHSAIGYSRSRLVVIPNGFHVGAENGIETAQAFRRSCGFTKTHTVIGCIGRFNAAKDHQNFVRAAGILAQQHADVRFLLAGEGMTTANPQLSQWIERTGFADRFACVGACEDMSDCLGALDIFCLSSQSEAFPNVVGEAMAAGIPCVVTDVGDAALLVGDTGLVVPSRDSAALAQALGKLAGLAPEERANLGRRARSRIASEFSSARSRQRYEDLYQSLARS